MKDLIISLSGVRGRVGESLTQREGYIFTSLFYTLYLLPQGEERIKVIVGRDPKNSGVEIIKGVMGALKEKNVEIINLGVTTLPIIEWAVKHYSAEGGIMVTASHNPIEWNGLKFISSYKEGAYLLSGEVMERIRKNWKKKSYPFPSSYWSPPVENYLEEYFYEVKEEVERLVVNCGGEGKKLLEMLKEEKIKIVIDATCKEGNRIPFLFLKSLGIPDKNLVTINSGSIEECSRSLEPSPPHLGELRRVIQEEKADIGFATDPDQDRLVAMPLKSEEHTPLLAGKFLLELQKTQGKKFLHSIVINLSTSAAWEELGERYGIKIVRVPVGEVNVVEGMRKEKTVFGVEGNGGVILSSVNQGRNSSVGILLLLLYLAWRGESIEKLEQDLPPYQMLKEKVKVSVKGERLKEWLKEGIERYLRERKEEVKEVDIRDGYRIFYRDNSWLHIRPSNTEPLVRIFVEKRGGGKKALKEKVEEIKGWMENFLS